MDNAKIYTGSEKTEILLNNGFKRFDDSVVDIYTSYLNKMNGPTGSYMRVANILCWEFYSVPYYIEKEGFFLIINDDAYYRTFSVHAPVGNYENIIGLSKVLIFLGEICKKLNIGFELIQIKEWMKAFLNQVSEFDVSYTFSEGESDYLFNFKEFKDSIARRATHYENAIKKFIETYEPEFIRYTEDDYDNLMKLVEKQYCNKYDCKTCAFGCVKVFHEKLIEYLDVYRGEIIEIKSRGKIIAFIVNSLDEDLLGVSMLTEPGLHGFTEYYYKYLVDNFADKFENLNIEEDMGLECIRIHKRGIGPHVLSHNYHGYLSKQ